MEHVKLERKAVPLQVLRRIFGPRRDEVTVERRRLNKEEINGFTVHPIL